MPKSREGPGPELKRTHKYRRALAAFGWSASEVLPREPLLHYVTAQVSRITHIKQGSTSICGVGDERGP